MSEKVLGEIKDLLIKQNAMLARQRGVVGSSLLEALPFLDGWTWVTDGSTSPIALAQGPQRTRIIDWPNEKGWLIAGYLMFSDPDSRVYVTLDSLNINSSPRGMNEAKGFQVGFSRIESPVFDASIGPKYGVSLGAFQGLPYKHQVTVEVQLPDTALNATAFLWYYQVSKILINNEKLFYESIERLGARETMGKLAV